MNKQYFLSLVFVFAFVIVIPQKKGKGMDRQDSLLQLIQTAPDKEKAALYQTIAKEYYKQQIFFKAYENFKRSLQWALSTGDSSLIAKSYNNIAVIFDLTGNYPEAVKYYKNALLYFRKLSDDYHSGCVFNNLGVIYEETKEPDRALNSYLSALKLKKQTKDTLSIAATFNNIGILYQNMKKDYDSAKFFYNKAFRYYSLKNNEKGQAFIRSSLGVILLKQNRIDSALENFRLSMHYYNSVNDRQEKATSLVYIANVYMAKDKFHKAITFYNRSLEIAIKLKLRSLMALIYRNRSDAYEQTGKYDKALMDRNRYEDLHDTLFNTEKIKLIKKYERSIKINEKDNEINLLIKQNEINTLNYNRLLLLVIAVVITFMLVIVLVIFAYKIKKQKDKEDLDMLKSRLVRSQMSPHFIFNTLMGIQTILMDREVEKAMDYIVDFARLMRNILTNSQKSWVSLDVELETLKQYLELEKMRFADKFVYDIQINMKVSATEVEIPPMMLQPFLENAIIHGLIPLEKTGRLLLKVEQLGNQLDVTIEDNGIGREKSKTLRKSMEHKSLAIELTLNRIKLLQQRFKKKIGFTIEDILDEKGEVAGTRVKFSFSLF